MIQSTLTDAAFNDLVTDLFGDAGDLRSQAGRQAERTRRDTLAGLFLDADTQAGIRGTAWAGYQAVAEYVDHFAPVRGGRRVAETRALRVLTSTEPTRIKRRAWAAMASR